MSMSKNRDRMVKEPLILKEQGNELELVGTTGFDKVNQMVRKVLPLL
jgi:hypothetical protein